MSIAKVGKTKVSGSLVDYVFKEEKGVEKQPKVIGGNVTGTKAEMKAEFREQEKLNSKVKNTATHFSISFPYDTSVSDEDAADFADELMQKTGYDENPYLVVRHFDKDIREVKPYSHIHIVASRIRSDGTLISEWKIAEKTIEATKEIDKQFKFESVQYIKQNEAEKRERNIKKDEYQMMSRTGKLSVLEEFKDCAAASLDKKRNIREFVKDVQNGGFEVLPNLSETNSDMKGFSFAKDGIVFTASRAGKQYKWANLTRSVAYQSAQDIEFLQELRAEVLAKKEAKKHTEKVIETLKIVAKPIKIVAEVIKNEATHQCPAIGQPIGNRSATSKEKSNSQTQIIEVEIPARSEANTGVAKTQVSRNATSQIRDDRTDDDTARSAKKIAGNNQTNFIAIKRDAERDTRIDAKSERRISSEGERNNESANDHRTMAIETVENSARQSRSGTRTDNSNEQISRFSSVVEEHQDTDSKGFTSSGNFDSRLSDRSQRPTKERNTSFTDAKVADAKSNKLDPATASGSKRGDSLKGEITGENDKRIEIITELFNRADDVSIDHNVVLLPDKQRLKRVISGREKEHAEFKVSVESGADRQDNGAGESGLYGQDINANIPRSREVLQIASSKTVGNYSNDAEAHRRTAEKAAQIINLKHFGGQLDSQMVADWTSIIEKSDAEAFLDEIIKPKDQEEQEKIFRHLDKQAEIIANHLKLPKPEPQIKIDRQKLALTLTTIEVVNFEEVTGEQISKKTFEVLVERNTLRAATPLQPEQLRQIEEEFDEISANLNFSSNLEAATLNALLNPQMVEADHDLIFQTQKSVATNEAAAAEIATLIQISYGGQQDSFTDEFKFGLTEQIYYSPIPPVEIYQEFRHLDWQKAIEGFAPIVNDIAEHYNIEIISPGNLNERNALLANFIAQELAKASESQNKPLEQYVQNEMAENALKTSKLEVSQGQKDFITRFTDKNLEPPEFSSSLEASVYNLSKFDNNKKAEKAEEIADQIRAAAQFKAEQEISIEVQKPRVLTMR